MPQKTEPLKSILGFEYENILHTLSNLGLNIVISVVILIAGFWLANKAGKMVTRLLQKSKTDAGLISFLTNLTVIASKILVVFTAMSQLGIAMTSFVTILGAAGIAIGMAFSGTLSNFAGGILILVINPFKLKDTISALLVTGEVTEIQIFNTYIKTADNKVIILPNGPLINGTIVNFTRMEKRRIDIVMPVKYGLGSEEIVSKIKETLENHPAILKDPKSQVFFTDFEPNFGKLNVICWVKTADHLNVHRELSNTFFEWLEPTQ